MKQVPFSEQQFLELTGNSLPLERENVRLTPDGRVWKIHVKRRLLSSATFSPLADRFIKGCETLDSRGFNAPQVTEFYRCESRKCDIVVYDLVQGETILAKLRRGDYSHMAQVAKLMAELHENGLFFRDFHLGNIVEHAGEYTLIDVDSIYNKKRPLSAYNRARNLIHLLNKIEGKEYFQAYGYRKFVSRYFLQCNLSGLGGFIFLRHCLKHWKGAQDSELCVFVRDLQKELKELFRRDKRVLGKNVIVKLHHVQLQN